MSHPRAATTFAVSLACLLPLSAQEEQRSVRPGLTLEALEQGAELVHVRYDVATGRITDRSDVEVPPESLLRGGGPIETTCFSTTAQLNWSVFEPFDEIVDWGTKSCGKSGWISAITISYRTRELDPSLGGPGGTLGLAIYGGTTGFGELGTELARFDLAGLPASFVAGSPGPVYVLTLDLGNQPIFLPDGPLGWGFSRIDDQTGPFLISGGAPFEEGVEDALDVYRPGPATDGNYEGTFNFGDFCGCGSFYLVLSEYEGLPRTQVHALGSADPTALAPMVVAFGAPFGGTFRALFSGATGGSFLALSSAALGVGTTSPFGEVLVDFGALLRPLHYSPTGDHELPVPTDPGLVGTVLFTQGIQLGAAGPRTTRGFAVTVGF